jgi:cellobiose transport system permease protein
LIRPTLTFAVVMTSIGGMQLFTEPMLFDTNVQDAGGGAAAQFQTINMYIYRIAWKYYNLGYAAALSWALFLVIVVLAGAGALLTNRIGGRK